MHTLSTNLNKKLIELMYDPFYSRVEKRRLEYEIRFITPGKICLTNFQLNCLQLYRYDL